MNATSDEPMNANIRRDGDSIAGVTGVPRKFVRRRVHLRPRSALPSRRYSDPPRALPEPEAASTNAGVPRRHHQFAGQFRIVFLQTNRAHLISDSAASTRVRRTG